MRFIFMDSSCGFDMKAKKQKYALRLQLLVSETNFDAPPEYNAYGIKTSSEEL